MARPSMSSISPKDTSWPDRGPTASAVSWRGPSIRAPTSATISSSRSATTPRGAKSYLPVYFDVARLRIEGRTSPEDLKSRVETGLRDGTYHSPTRSGVAYMLAPIITAYHGPG